MDPVERATDCDASYHQDHLLILIPPLDSRKVSMETGIVMTMRASTRKTGGGFAMKLLAADIGGDG